MEIFPFARTPENRTGYKPIAFVRWFLPIKELSCKFFQYVCGKAYQANNKEKHNQIRLNSK